MHESSGARLPRSFFSRPTRLVARELLGCQLIRVLEGTRLAGIIVETEAYIGERDLACHAKAGKTTRTAVMYGPAGFSYVYFTYGMHWMLNIVTEREGVPAAVLIRALQPTMGMERMKTNRGTTEHQMLCRGPARLTQAMEITKKENGLDLCHESSSIWIQASGGLNKRRIAVSSRIGLGNTPEPWLSKRWRYFIEGNPFVSGSSTRSSSSLAIAP